MITQLKAFVGGVFLRSKRFFLSLFSRINFFAWSRHFKELQLKGNFFDCPQIWTGARLTYNKPILNLSSILFYQHIANTLAARRLWYASLKIVSMRQTKVTRSSCYQRSWVKHLTHYIRNYYLLRWKRTGYQILHWSWCNRTSVIEKIEQE